MTTNENSLLQIKTRKKNDFLPLEAGAYSRMYIAQIEADMEALATGKLDEVRRVSIDPRTGRFRLTFGFGKRVAWFPNPYFPKGEFADYDDLDEVMRILRAILTAARAGEFDKPLEKLRTRRQEHARKMIDARDSCGFHKAKGRALPAPSEFPIEHVAHESDMLTMDR